jgi:hypothetical protein
MVHSVQIGDTYEEGSAMTPNELFNLHRTRSRARSLASGSLMLAALAVMTAPDVRAQQSKSELKPPPAAYVPTPAPIDRNGVLILIRSTLIALDHANKTGNYTVLRDLGSPAFQSNTAARLAEVFAPQRKENIDLSGVVVLEPQLTLLPQIEANGMMHMAGFFPSVPTQVNFEMAFAPVDRQWRLFGVSISFGQAAPVAPPPPEPEQVTPQAQAAPPKAHTSQAQATAPKANTPPPHAAPPALAAKSPPSKGEHSASPGRAEVNEQAKQ